MSDVLLRALRDHACAALGRAQTEVERARLERWYADYVLRNRAKLLALRLEQTRNPRKRREIVRRALLGG